MQGWLIYLPVVASVAAVAVSYLFLRSSAKQLQRHREAVLEAQAAIPQPEQVHVAMKPVEKALERAVQDMMVGIDQRRAAAERAEPSP